MRESARVRVLNYISSQVLVPGCQLPAESVLAQELGLSRNSVREAYADLLANELIIRQHGVGTFVATPPVLNSFGGMTAFWTAIQQSNRRADLLVLNFGQAPLPPELVPRMGLEHSAPLSWLRWLFTADSEPCVLIDHFFAPGIAVNSAELERARSVMPALSDHVGEEEPIFSSQTSAVNATAELADILAVSAGDALLAGVATVDAGRVLLCSRSWMVPRLLNIHKSMPLTPLHFVAPTSQSGD